MISPAMIMQGVKAGAGLLQMAKGFSDRSKLERPEYQVQDEIKQNLSSARATEREGLAAATVNRAQQQIDRQTGAALSASGDRMGGLAGLGGVSDAANQGMMNILSADAAARQAARTATSAARTAMANAKDKAFNINKLQPYQQDLAAAQSNIGAGMQNLFGAGDSVAAMYANRVQSGEDTQALYDEAVKKGDLNPGIDFVAFSEAMNKKSGDGGVINPQNTNQSFLNPMAGFRGGTMTPIIDNGQTVGYTN